MGKNRKKILMYPCNNDLRLKEYINLANTIKESFDILFLIFLNTRDAQRDIKLLQDNNLEYKIITTDIKIKSSSILAYEKIAKVLRVDNILLSKDHSLGQLYHKKLFLDIYKNGSDAVDSLLKEESIDIVMMTQDSGWSPVGTALLSLSKIYGYKVVLPYLMYHAEEGTYQTLLGNKKYQNSPDVNLYQRYIFNKHKDIEYKGYHYLPAFLIDVLDTLGVLSTYPWRFGFNPLTTKLFVPNIGIYNEVVDIGLDKDRVSIMPDVSYIELYKAYSTKESIKESLISKYNLKNRKFILFSVSNFYHHQLMSKEEELAYIKNICKELSKFSDEYNILISLKPVMKREDYSFFEDEFGFVILDEKIMNIMPIADLFVVTYSSTILWAVLCNVKVLMIDYMYSLDSYYEYDSIQKLTDEDKLYESIKDTLSSEVDFSIDYKNISRDEVFNDNIAQKYINELNSLP
jgi:hypothetical protein